LKHAVHAVEAEKAVQEEKLSVLQKLSDELHSEGVSDLSPSVHDLQTKYSTFHNELASRNSALAAEHDKQHHNENLRVSFAEKAKALDFFILENNTFLNSAGQGELEDQLKEVQARKPTINGAQSQLQQVHDVNQQLEAAAVTTNPHTALTYASLQVALEQLVKNANNKESLLQREILQKKNSSVSASQLAEFKEVFEHFDKDKTGNLGRLEFKSCLQSLGEDPTDQELDRLLNTLGTNGKIPFEQFVSHMSQRAADVETQEQILEAFRVLAGDKQFITESDMRKVMPAEKVDYLVKHMPKYQGSQDEFDYVAWATSAFSR
jgi:actinin alpha